MGRANVGMSNHYPNEKSGPRKSKVSVALAINHGLGDPKLIPKGAGDGQPVNIPALPCGYPLCDEGHKYTCLIGLASFMASGSNAAAIDGTFRFSWANVCEEPSEKSISGHAVWDPYRKPTLVDRASSPRGTSKSSLRNSAKKRPYLRYKAFPHHFGFKI